MLISASVGIFVLGLFTVLAEASPDIKTWLQGFEMGLGVGPLAGKVATGTIAYVVSLGALWALWRDKDVNLACLHHRLHPRGPRRPDGLPDLLPDLHHRVR